MKRLDAIPVTTIDGEARTFGEFAGKLTLVVNVASQCGFTPQYAGLEALHQKFKERGLSVLGFPCNQFGAQEPGGDQTIKTFCSLNYDVTFPMFAKIEVNGAQRASVVHGLEEGRAGPARDRSDQMEFHQISDRRRGQCSQALRAESCARSDWSGDREAAVKLPIHTTICHPREKRGSSVSSRARRIVDLCFASRCALRRRIPAFAGMTCNFFGRRRPLIRPSALLA